MGSVWLFGVLQGSQPTSIRQARSGGAGNIRVLSPTVVAATAVIHDAHAIL